jgi:hypothetical protein
MSIADKFKSFLDNIKVSNDEQISDRYGEITLALNKEFRDSDSSTANNLRVGSYGRWTAIKGISDLDMLYIMPAGKWEDYKNGGQSKLLQDTKNAIKARYPRTDIFVDSPVVRVLYTNFHVEVQPVFKQDDGSYLYPDTRNGGSWKTTKPREEMDAMKTVNEDYNRNLRRLCKMVRAWKNKHGVGMGGLLIDTLAHNFIQANDDYKEKSYLYYDWMSRDFFKFLADQPDKEYYAALGSGQRVKVKEKFQKSANKAYELCLKAIEDNGKDTENAKWQKIYGRQFPSAVVVEKAEASTYKQDYKRTEEFVEDSYSVDIRNKLRIDCEVTQNGYRPDSLRNMLMRNFKLSPKKSLKFNIVENDTAGDYDVYWKVLNRGDEAKRRDCVRGQVVQDSGLEKIEEHTNFSGDHIVECYIVKNNVVVAKDRIHVPIE